MSMEDIKNENKKNQFVESKKKIIYKNANEIKIKPVHWLFKGFIARGKVTMIAGNPGLGKSQLTASFAAIVSTGGKCPTTDTNCEVGDVIFFSAEDDASDTIVPRLRAAKADTSRIKIVEFISAGIDEQGNVIEKNFDLNTDLIYLDQMLIEIKDVSLIVFDPITAYLGNTDSHKMAEVRGLLTPLTRLAEKHNVAIICISHLNKSQNQDALARFIGSIGFVAAARAAYIVAKDKNDPTKRLFIPAKNNIGPDEKGLIFSIESITITEDQQDIETSKVVWSNETTSITADEALSATSPITEKSAKELAEDFLHDTLKNGRVLSSEIDDLAKKYRHSESAVRRAKDSLGIKAKRAQNQWFCELPKNNQNHQGSQDAKDTQTKNLSALNALSTLDSSQSEEDTPV